MADSLKGNNNPLISIIMPVYNVSDYIDEAIQSICSQTYDNFELIIINDGSTDNTVERINAWIEKDARIILMSQKNGGPGNARNKGLKISKGSLICFIDADDLYDIHKVYKQQKIFSQYPQINLVFSDMYYMDEMGVIQEQSHHESINFPERAKEYLFKENNIFLEKKLLYIFMSVYIVPISTQTIMFRRSLLLEQDYWFFEKINNGEDTDLWFRLAQKGGIAYSGEKLAYYRIRDGSLTKNKENLSLGFIYVQNINYERSKELLTKEEDRYYRYRIAREHEILAYFYRKNKNKLKSIQFYLKSFRYRFSAMNFYNILKVIILP